MTTEALAYTRVAELGGTLTVATASQDTAVVITLAGAEGVRHVIDRVIFSLSANPTAAVALTVAFEDGATLNCDVTSGGVGPNPLGRMYGEVGKSVTITLAAAGGAIIGKLNVWHY